MKVWMKNKVIQKYRRSSKRRQQEIYEEMLLGNQYGGIKAIFNPRVLAWLVVMVTMMLQIISLATTYEGSKVYFGGVAIPFGMSAPLLFALAVQLIVFYMGHMIKKYFRVGLVAILLMATLCSTYFSYVGIYNYIHSPIAYLEERYGQIREKLTDEHKLKVEDAKEAMKNYTFGLIGVINQEYIGLENKVMKNNELSKKIENVKVEGGKLGNQTANLKKPNINAYGDNLEAYYKDMAKYNATIGNMITDTTKQEATLKNELYTNQVNALLGGQSKEDFEAESIAAKTKKQQLKDSIASTYQLVGVANEGKGVKEKLMAIQQYIVDYILLEKGEEQVVSTALNQLVNSGVEVDENLEILKDNVSSNMLLLQKEKEIMKPIEILKGEISSNVTEEKGMQLYTVMEREIKQATHLLDIDSNNQEYRMHNLYVLPIKNLIEPSGSRAMALFCLGFAVLIDGLTLLFALMDGKERNILKAKKNKEVVGNTKEEMEQLLMHTLVANIGTKRQEDRITDTLNALREFMQPFTIMPEGIQDGYALWCPLGTVKKYEGWIAILCQFNLATIIDREEENNMQYVLLRTKFILWTNEKIADLTLKEEYLESTNEKVPMDLNTDELI